MKPIRPRSAANARKFLNDAIDAGAHVSWRHGHNGTGHPWVMVTALFGTEQRIIATWSTHITGTTWKVTEVLAGTKGQERDVNLSEASYMLTDAAAKTSRQ